MGQCDDEFGAVVHEVSTAVVDGNGGDWLLVVIQNKAKNGHFINRNDFTRP
jgi:hypothetical protein